MDCRPGSLVFASLFFNRKSENCLEVLQSAWIWFELFGNSLGSFTKSSYAESLICSHFFQSLTWKHHGNLSSSFDQDIDKWAFALNLTASNRFNRFFGSCRSHAWVHPVQTLEPEVSQWQQCSANMYFWRERFAEFSEKSFWKKSLRKQLSLGFPTDGLGLYARVASCENCRGVTDWSNCFECNKFFVKISFA